MSLFVCGIIRGVLGRLLITVLGCVFVFAAGAADSQPDVEIGGLVLDRSISRFGKEFYREFSLLWQEVKGTAGYNVTVLESVIPRSGTVLWLEINQAKVFQTFFGRRNNDTVRQTAERAVNQALEFLARQAYQTDNPDMLGNGF